MAWRHRVNMAALDAGALISIRRRGQRRRAGGVVVRNPTATNSLQVGVKATRDAKEEAFVPVAKDR